MKTNQAPNSGIKAGPSTLNARCSLRDTILHAAPLKLVLPWFVLANSALGTVRYVDANSATPTPPYTSWATAATNIQHAVDAAVAGELILVTNGLYGTGGWVVYGALTNRLAVTKAVTVQSVNGPGVTTIAGYQVPGTTNGAAAVRCVYLTNGAALAGFTLTNGATQDSGDSKQRSGGGVWSEPESTIVSNCVIVGNSAYYGGGAYQGTLDGCTIAGNSAACYGGGTYSGTLDGCTLTGNTAVYQGGGTYWSTLNYCTVTGNRAADGGGACGGTLNYCTLTANTAADTGGGACGDTVNQLWRCTLNYCTLSGNSARGAGGTEFSALNNCTLTANSASGSGGGASGSNLKNCALSGNSASEGGGVIYSALTNCTVTGNSAHSGGGALSSTLNNCIVFYNNARANANYDRGWCSLDYCCTTPLPSSGTGNLDAEPQLASALHLSASSPGRGAGSAIYASGSDIDGEPWADPPSMGCDEYCGGSITGALSAAILASYTNVATGFSVDFQALISGHASASRWEFGDGTALSNRPYASHAWAVEGDYVITLRACNESYPKGLAATATVHVVAQPVHYVSLSSLSPVPPYTSWATAATNIQDAVDAAFPGGEVVVTNGLYLSGGRAIYGLMTNRVAVGKPLALRSVNGPQSTIIQGRQVPGTTNGDGAMRCAYLMNGASLSGFTLANGATRDVVEYERYTESCGGGVWCESPACLVSNCVLAGNSAHLNGGGACYGTLNNCTLDGNRATELGGGAHNATLSGCILTRNAAGSAGGAYASRLVNCTLAGNSVTNAGGGAGDSALSNCVLSNNIALWGGGANGGTLENCILTGNAATNSGGGTASAVLTNCTLSGNWAANYGGGAYQSTLNHCTLSTNSMSQDSGYRSGGGAYGSWLLNCTLTGNTAGTGGGAGEGTLDYCTLTGNSADFGGGALGGTLNNCALTGNSAGQGGGAGYSTLNDCDVRSNTAGDGGGAYGSTLNDCTVTGNSAWMGGGAYSGTLTNCTLTGNSAYEGGGALWSTLNGCALTGNSADYGGGVSMSTLNNCTIVGNSASVLGGGARGWDMPDPPPDPILLNNCIVYFNTAPDGANSKGCTLDYCCTTPMPPDGSGNITTEPLFVNPVGGNLRLQTNSPCINAGNNAYVTGSTDLDGRPRVVSGTVDMGAYEFQGVGMGEFIAWLRQYGLPTDGAADLVDFDADGHNNWQEWCCLTDPTNALSALRLVSAVPDGTNVLVSWQSVAGVNYLLERSMDLAASPCFAPLAAGIPGQAGTTTFTHTNAAGLTPLFYRVGVGN